MLIICSIATIGPTSCDLFRFYLLESADHNTWNADHHQINTITAYGSKQINPILNVLTVQKIGTCYHNAIFVNYSIIFITLYVIFLLAFDLTHHLRFLELLSPHSQSHSAHSPLFASFLTSFALSDEYSFLLMFSVLFSLFIIPPIVWRLQI